MIHRPQKILRKLQETFSLTSWTHLDRTPFESLIVTIISQNTAQRNTTKAFERLANRSTITPEDLAEIETERIEQSLKVAGLYRNKAKSIKRVSKLLLEKFQGSLEPIFSMPLREARETLMQFPGVGPKTADVVLLFSAGKHTIPIDTHVNRVSKRLGLVAPQAKYEEVRKSLQSLYSPRDYLAVHLLWIQLGRNYCKARNPLCEHCPVDVFCPSSHSL